MMDNLLTLSILLSISAFTKGDNDGDDSFPHTAVSSSVGSVVFIVLLACLIYYCCCRNRTSEGFSRFNNENVENQPRGRNRWRNRRFFRRNRHQNYAQTNQENQNTTNVIIQPVLTVEVPPREQSFGVPQGEGGRVPGMPTAPPGYNESVNNPPMPNQFMNPPMPNQFMNPPMPSQFMNPPMPGQFMNPPMPSNFDNPPPQNPNVPSYHTKY